MNENQSTVISALVLFMEHGTPSQSCYGPSRLKLGLIRIKRKNPSCL